MTFRIMFKTARKLKRSGRSISRLSNWAQKQKTKTYIQHLELGWEFSRAAMAGLYHSQDYENERTGQGCKPRRRTGRGDRRPGLVLREVGQLPGGAIGCPLHFLLAVRPYSLLGSSSMANADVPARSRREPYGRSEERRVGKE